MLTQQNKIVRESLSKSQELIQISQQKQQENYQKIVKLETEKLDLESEIQRLKQEAVFRDGKIADLQQQAQELEVQISKQNQLVSGLKE